ncbi:MAG: LysM peptidoglycan-binding domain-containing protein [Microbacteriaceae bacterium]
MAGQCGVFDMLNEKKTASPQHQVSRKLMQTMPLVMASSLVLSLNLAGVDSAKAQPSPEKDKQIKGENKASVIPLQSEASPNDTAAISVATSQLSYTVKKGDTVSGIAQQHGISTASILALNGLGWSSLIFPGQQLLLSKGSVTPITPAPTPAPAPQPGNSSDSYTVKAGDTVSGIAAKFGVSTQGILDLNGLNWKSIIYPKQVLKVPASATAPSNDNAAQPAPPATSAPAPASCTAVSYTIMPGDTVSRIASKFGVKVQTVLSANGLGLNSLIFAGQKLTIPGATLVSDDCQVHAELSTEMLINARIIVEVGRSAGVSDYGLVIALATAAQESGLRNINYGDRDSVGLFQQRPSTGWGTVEQIMDPYRSAKAFFGGSVNPNPGKTRGLLDIRGWEGMSVTKAAQAVQISGFPEAYAKWEASARHWLSLLK